MAGKPLDLSRSGVHVPNPVVVDTSVVVARILDTYSDQNRTDFTRAAAFFDLLQSTGQQAIVTPTVFSEIVHAAIKALYKQARSTYRSALITHYGRPGGFSWLDLYKLNPSILQERAADLERLRRRLVASNLVILSPEDLGPIPSGRRYDAELLDVVCRYGLDTSDATILMEAARVGIFEIVSFDQDMRRVVEDFDIYTWLS